MINCIGPRYLVLIMNPTLRSLAFCFILLFAGSSTVLAQRIEFPLGQVTAGVFEVVNLRGRVNVISVSRGGSAASPGVVAVAGPRHALAQDEIVLTRSASKVRIEVKPSVESKRIDLTVCVPNHSTVHVISEAGEVHVEGDLAAVNAKTETGSIAVDVPDDRVDYDMEWTQSRPRIMSDFQLATPEERRAGRFVIRGSYSKTGRTEADRVSLKFSTGRGIVLINVAPGQMPANLEARPLTEAAKAIVRSGDSSLVDAIRRASPKQFAAYSSGLAPARREPSLGRMRPGSGDSDSNVRKVIVQVVDTENRAVADLRSEEFEVVESGAGRDVISVEATTTPFNLVLLLDVSGSVENYQEFIRTTARAFVGTADPRDRISIVIFNDDVKVLSDFTSDRAVLNESLGAFDAGGGTAYYDALAFVLADRLKALGGERSAVVILSDGDDNSSFIPFDSLLGSMEESGALIYPVYVPSGLITGSRMEEVDASIDPLRRKFMSLTSKAEAEGVKLSEVSGGVYFPIRKLGEIQRAYDEIVRQLRTAYTVTFRSEADSVSGTRVSPKVKIKVKRKGVFVKIGAMGK